MTAGMFAKGGIRR